MLRREGQLCTSQGRWLSYMSVFAVGWQGSWLCYILFCQINSNLFQQPCWSICLFLIKIKSSFEALNFLGDHNKVGDKNRLGNDFVFTGTEKGFHWIVSSLFDWKVRSFEMLQSGVGGSLGSQAGRLANTRSYDADKLMYETLGKLTHSSLPSERLYFDTTII